MPDCQQPIMDAFFSELATLGFIGAIAFTLTCTSRLAIHQPDYAKAVGEVSRGGDLSLHTLPKCNTWVSRESCRKSSRDYISCISRFYLHRAHTLAVCMMQESSYFLLILPCRVTLLKSKQWADWEYELTQSQSYTRKKTE
eukprot:65086-Hanusia_phi.AAC.2